MIVVGLAVSFAIFLSNGAYQNWKSSPVLTTVWTTGHPIEQVPFPSVTICAQGSVNEIIGKLDAIKLENIIDNSEYHFALNTTICYHCHNHHLPCMLFLHNDMYLLTNRSDNPTVRIEFLELDHLNYLEYFTKICYTFID